MTWTEAMLHLLKGKQVRQKSRTRHISQQVPGVGHVLDTGVEPIKATTAWDLNGLPTTILIGVISKEPVHPDLQMVSADDWEVVP